MNQRHPIDDLFRRHLADSSVEPPAYMWDRIAQARRRQRQKRAWLWGGSLSLVASLLLTWLLWQPAPELGSFAIAIPPSATALAEAPAAQASAPEIMRANPEATTNASANKNTATPVNTATAASKVAVSRSKTDLTTAVQPALASAKRAKGTTAEEKSLTASGPVQNHANQVASEDGKAEATGLVESVAGAVEADGSISQGDSRIAGPHQRDRMLPVSRLPELTMALERDIDFSLFSTPTTRCARFAEKFLKVDMEVLAGPAYAHQQLQSRTVEGLEHLNDRQATESARLSFTGGFRIAATSSSGLGLRTGLAYTQINDRFEHVIGTMVDTSIMHQYDPNGNIISSDTTWSSKVLTATENNTLRFVEIPLLLTYEKQWGKLRVAVNGGAYLNVAFAAEGELLSPATGEPVPFGQAGDAGVLPVFSKKATAAWYGSATVAYNLHSRMSIIAEPFFKTYPRALTNPDYDLQQNYWIAGMQVGMRMRL